MNVFTIYHNAKCSKSRKALEILQSHHINTVIIEYLKSPLSLEQITQLRAHFDLKDFVRHNEPVFKELNLVLEDEANVLNAILKEPILLQRPIVTYGGKAIIARPPEKVLALITDNEEPLNVKTINKKTQSAIEELESGKGERFKTMKNVWDSVDDA